MDRIISLAVTILLDELRDGKQLRKLQPVMLKVFRTIAIAYSTDEAFLKVMRTYVVPPEVQ